MAFERGGYADKLGNRYEGRWVVKQLLRVLTEQIQSVSIVLIGDDEQGVDLWVETSEGIRQAQQCKARNKSRDSWSVADLNQRGILSYMQLQLERDPTYEFALVSGVPETQLADICESARSSTGRPPDFYRYQIEEAGRARREAFRDFCRYIGLDSDNADDRVTAFSLLRRTHFIWFRDDQNTRDDLCTWAAMLVAGQPRLAIAALAEFADDPKQWRRPLRADEVRTYLANLGFSPKQLAHDTRIAPAVEHLQQEFTESIRPRLIGGKLIARDETRQILDGIGSGTVVIVHGRAGHGKTSVLLEVTRHLQEQGIPYLPIRLDRRPPRNTTRQFGQDIGLYDSPALCLAALAGERPCVLVLDQLDALRWTSAHSANALEVCKALVREVRGLRNAGKEMSAVLACRSSDLEHDPEIKNWLEGPHRDTYRRIEVKAFGEDAVRKVVEHCGDRYGDLPGRQKQVLQSPQNLGLWVELRRSGPVPAFRSATELMRSFWEDRYRALHRAGFSEDQVHSALDAIVEYMDRHACLCAPVRLLAGRPTVSDALHSLGIMQTADHEVSFSHQSYLDFLVADRLLRKMGAGHASVRSWMGTKENQSLLRREQLRQILCLLSDESPDDFLTTVQGLLPDPGVRFHLKHLVLELLSQMEHPRVPLVDYVVGLLGDAYWRPHVVETVCWGREQFVRPLLDRGIIQAWLNSSENDQINSGLWLLRSLKVPCGDMVARVLEQHLEKGDDWPQRILNIVPLRVGEDTNRLFELRLRLARMGHAPQHVDWKALAEAQPRRAIRLIEAVLSSRDRPEDQPETLVSLRAMTSRPRLERWTHQEFEALAEASHKHAGYTWDALMPHVDRLTAVPLRKYDHRLDEWQDRRSAVGDSGIEMPRGVVQLLHEAGRALAKKEPNELLKRTRPLRGSISRITQQILADVYASLPADHADEAIHWLVQDTARLGIGAGYTEPEWMPAARLIEAMSPHCSAPVFQKLEDTVLRHSAFEKQAAKYCIKSWRQGHYRPWFGQAQHFLLPALCPKRRSERAEGLIGVLRRKFAGWSKDDFLTRSRARCASVVSPLPPEKLHQISDNAWLRIIHSKKIQTQRGGTWRQVGPDHITESSVEYFARDLGTVASRYPERFARLALRFPKDVHPDYLHAILDAVASARPNAGVPEDERAAWRAAAHETIEAVFHRFCSGNEREVALAFCWLIRKRAAENWRGKTVDRLLHYARNHADPAPGGLNACTSADDLDCNGDSVRSLMTNALDCVRGVAGRAIAALLWEHREWLSRLQPAIDHLVRDPHPAVRMAAVEACLPVLNVDKDLAVKWFCAACAEDLRVAASDRAVHIFNSAIRSHFAELSPIILRMLDSNRDDVAQQGAEEVTARWLFFGMFEQELARCSQGRVPHRKGVAQVAGHFLANESYTEKCRGLLVPLFDDADADVRQKCFRALSRTETLRLPRMPHFVATFVQSQAFRDDPTWLLMGLEEYSDTLLPYSNVIFAICEVLAGPLAEQARSMARDLAHDLSYLAPLLLRLYEQAQDAASPEVRNRCLDAWDQLFESRVGLTRDLTRAIEE